MAARLHGRDVGGVVRRPGGTLGIALVAGLFAAALVAAHWLGGPRQGTALRPAAAPATVEQERSFEIERLDVAPPAATAEREVVRDASPAVRDAGEESPPAALDDLRFAVTSAADGEPVPLASVWVEGVDGDFKTNAEGRVTLPFATGDDPAGLYYHIRADGLATARGVLPPIQREVAVALRASVSLTVTVLDAAGQPAAGLGVTGRQQTDGESHNLASCSTDADGNAQLAGLWPNVPVALCVASRWRMIHDEDVAFENGGHHVLRLPPTGEIAGRALTPTGDPAAELEVTCEQDVWGSGVARSRTGDDGSFRIALLDVPGTYLVRVGDALASGHQLTHLTEDVPRAELVLQLASAALRVDVLVTDHEGGPLERALITCQPTDAQSAGPLPPDVHRGAQSTSKWSDDRGTAVLVPSAAGSHRVSAVYGEQRAETAVEVVRGIPVQARLRMDRGATLRGRVLATATTDVARMGGEAAAPTPVPVMAEITLERADAESSDPVGPVASGADGMFELRGVRSGPATLVVRRELRGSGLSGVQFARFPDCRPADDTLEFVLPPPGRVIARLVPRPDEVRIEWGLLGVGYRAFPGSRLHGDGRIEIFLSYPDPVDLSILHGTLAHHVVRGVAVRPGETTDLGTLTPALGLSVWGSVVDSAGEPVEGADVTITVDGTSAELVARTGADGWFGIDGVPDAARYLDVWASGYASASHELPSNGGEVVVHLLKEGRIEGRLRIAGKTPKAAFEVLASGLGPEGFNRGNRGCQGSPDGSFSLDLEPGRYGIFVVPFGCEEKVLVVPEVEVCAAETRYLDLELPR